jgi:DNA polymerase-3 subunit gamma/tau
MSYLVLARKWRPKYFDDVVGQEHVARTLENSIEQERVHHAYLFCGARGVGKTSTARILAKCLNCEEGPTSTPCYDCKSCEDITEGQSVDVYEIDGASNRGINEIRELREGVRYAPSQGRVKIYIIDEVHMLTTEAFNALLKTLEEPPDHAYFIFATTEPQKIPITILSRCQRFDFKRISQDDIVGHLADICQKEGLEVDTEALQLIARQADGAMRDALSLLDQVIGFAGDKVDEEEVANILGVANREHLFDISGAILKRDAQGALGALDVVDRYGYDLQQFASELVSHLRDLTVTAAADDPARVTDLTASELEEAHSQLGHMEVTGERRRQLLHRYFSVMAEGARKMTRSPYPKLIFEMTLVRLTDLEPLVELDLLVDRLEALEGEFDGSEPAVSMPADTGGAPRQTADTPPNSQAGDGAPADDSSQTDRQTRESPRETSADSSVDGGEPAAGDRADDDDAEDDDTDDADVDADAGDTAADADRDTGDAEGDADSESGDSQADADDEAGDTDTAETGAGDTGPGDSGPDERDTGDDDAGAETGDDETDDASADDQSGLAPPDRPTPPPPDQSEPPPPEPAPADVDDSAPTHPEHVAEADDPGDPEERWAMTVERLRERFGMMGVKFEHAHPERFERGRIDLVCAPEHRPFFEREDHLADIERAAAELFGGRWEASIEAWEQDNSERETLADQREAEYQQRLEDLYDEVRHDEAVEQVEQAFDLEEDDIRVRVDLEE